MISMITGGPKARRIARKGHVKGDSQHACNTANAHTEECETEHPTLDGADLRWQVPSTR